jgi:hypothetical protein
MTVRAKIRFGRNGWERIEPKPAPADLNIIVAALHTLAARITAVEQALANITAPAVKPTRARRPITPTVG